MFFLWLLPLLLAAAESLTVLVTADLHAATEQFSALGARIEQERRAAGAGNTLWIDCGDTGQGTYFGAATAGLAGIDFLNRHRCDVWIPGNHDFEFGFPALLQQIRTFKGETLGADWQFGGYRPTGVTLLARGGKTIAVIGLGEALLRSRTLPAPGFEQSTQEEALRRVMPEVRRAKADLVILATHNGRYFRGGDLGGLLRRYPEIDLVLGAHTHQEEPGRRMARAWYVQPGSHARALGIVRVEFPRTADDGPRPRFRSQLEEIPREPHAPLPKETLRLIGTSSVPLRQPERGAYHAPLSELAALALMSSGRADCAFFGASPGKDDAPGITQLTVGNLYRLFPFENRVAVVRMEPEELKSVVKEALLLVKTHGFVPYFLGIKANFATGEIQLPPAGPDGKIGLAAPDYLLAGRGGQLPALGLITRKYGATDTGIPLREAVARYLAALPGYTFVPGKLRWLELLP